MCGAFGKEVPVHLVFALRSTVLNGHSVNLTLPWKPPWALNFVSARVCNKAPLKETYTIEGAQVSFFLILLPRVLT